jgi:hypothetical protein
VRAFAVALVPAATVVAIGFVLWDVLFAGISVSGSGGVGAVSAGVSEAFMMIALVGSVLANRLFARLARSRGGLVRRAHQAQSVALLLLALTIGAMFGLGKANPHSGLWFVLIAMLLFVLQSLFLGFLLALLAFTARPASAS